ncbi:MAG: M20/M25/M40 family metallo-hydrolase, partial [Clostridia bacterium]
MTIVWILLVALVCLIGVLVARALAFRPQEEALPTAEPFPVDVQAATAHLQAMIRCKTISDADEARIDTAEFVKFQALLRQLYPATTTLCEPRIIGMHGILMRWKGQSSAAPSVMMAHYDVVPVNQEDWTRPAFEGLIENGELWGRGTLDTKCTLLGVMEAAEVLIKRGFVPKNDVYFAFGGNEECMGTDAEAIVRELERLNVHPAFVLDEGGAVVEGVFPGVKRPAAVIGIAEKGSAFIDLTVLGKGGHASAPPAQQCVGTLARALSRLEKHAFPFHITAPAQKLFNVMGRHAPFGLRLVFANLWCFAPLLNLLCKKSGGELNALVRTTCAFTKLRASDAYNVLPSQCKAGVNLRILCEESMESVQKRMSRIIADDTVKISLVHGSEPSPISLTSG